MNPNVGSTNFIQKLTAIALSLLLCQPTFAQSSENQQMVFEGSLTDTNENPISLAGAQLDFYITANGCYLYGESSSVSGDSQGNILHRFGQGSVIAGSPNVFSQNLFFGTVTGTTTFAGNNCTVTATDTRLAQVYYPAQNISATIKLGTVPYAQNAATLAGKSVTDFVQTNADTNTLFSGGMTGQYLTKSASGLTWTTLAANSGTVTSVSSSNSDITITLGTTTPMLTLNAGSGAGQIPRLDASARLPAVDGSQLLSLNASNLITGIVSSALLADSGVTAGTYTKVTVDTKGRVTSAGSLASSDVTSALGYTPANSTVVLSSLNGSTNSSQTFSTGAAGTSFNISTAGGVHTFNIPSAATSSTTAGLLSNADYTVFTNKITSSSAAVAQVLGYAPANSTTVLIQSANLSDVNDKPAARNNLGLGTLAVGNSIDLGSASATGILATSRLPALAGDVTSTNGSNVLTVAKIQNVSVAASAPTTGQVLKYNGTQWAPGIDNSPVWSTNGTSIYYNSGSVGIGTTNPTSSSLQIVGNQPTYNFIVKIQNNTMDGELLQGLNSYGNEVIGLRKDYLDNGLIAIGNASGTRTIQLFSSGDSYLAGGNVGIGTSTPTQKLDVNGRTLASDLQTTSALPISDQGAYLQWNRTNGDGATWLVNQKGGGPGGIRFGEADATNNVTEKMRIDANGNVGIGTATPTSTLTVNGPIESKTGGYTFPDGTTQTSAVSGYEIVTNQCTNSSGGTQLTMSCSSSACPGAKKVIGGGCRSDSNGSHTIQDSGPLSNTWSCYFKNVPNGVTIIAHAICMNVP